MLGSMLDWLGVPRTSPFTGASITIGCRVLWWLGIVDDNPIFTATDDVVRIREGKVPRFVGEHATEEG